VAENIIQKKSFEFALEIIQLYRKLQEEREYVISKQLLRSGISIGANVEEASAGQSRKDFLAKNVCSLKRS
jgi:four helix bundle protein